jgi:hypothetical protein
MKRIEKARRSARQVYERLRRWLGPPYATRIVEDYLPKQLQKQTLYIVQDDGLFEQAAMLCPCGCKRILHMNLLPDEHPCWRVTQHKDGTASLSPSVCRKTDCQSHFWFTRGRIRWFKGGIRRS